MILGDNRFYFGNVSGFLSLVKLLNSDPEFRIAFDFQTQAIEIESMMMAGVIGMGIRLVKSSKGILLLSPTTRTDRVTLRVDSGAFQRTIIGINSIPYAYMCLWIDPEDVSICMETYGSDHVRISYAILSTMTLDEHDTDFLVTSNTMKDSLSYEFVVTHPGSTWRRYIQSSTVDTVLRYTAASREMAWETRNQHSTMSLYLGLDPTAVSTTKDVYVCLLPSVVTVIRNVLQATDKYATVVSVSDDLPIRLFAQLDSYGSFIRVYAGTKDDS
jgi:hypothetical protein